MHSLSCELDLENYEQSKVYHRAQELIVIPEYTVCEVCMKHQKNIEKSNSRMQKNINKHAHLNAPLSNTHPNRVKLALQEERMKSSKLLSEVERMKKEIKTNGIHLDQDLSNDIETIMSENSQTVSPFMRLFWEQQKHLFQGGCKQYHPMIIRFCLSLASKSAAAYDELRNSNVLVLPSRRTLRVYKNAIKPITGFNPEVVAELTKTASKLSGAQRFVVLSFDEIKIQQNLVFNKYSGELIG